MFSGRLGNDYGNLPLAIRESLEYLEHTDFSKMPDGEHPVRGDKIFATISRYKPLPKKSKFAEQHRKFLDIHYMVSGREKIFFSSRKSGSMVVKDYDPVKDCTLYTTVKSELFILLENKRFIILYPSDIHRSGCECHGEKEVRKVVIKIPVDLL